MIRIFAALVVILIILVVAEYLYRLRKISVELTRKLVHISVGVFVAFWPLVFSWKTIELISLAFVVVVLFSHQFRVFKAIHSVERTTWGELMFALTVLVLAALVHTDWLFAAALLHLSLADGFAAISGTKAGKNYFYNVFGHKKSIVGTITFYVISVFVIYITAVLWAHLTWTYILWVPLLATFMENVAVGGTDNIFVPLIVILALR